MHNKNSTRPARTPLLLTTRRNIPLLAHFVIKTQIKWIIGPKVCKQTKTKCSKMMLLTWGIMKMTVWHMWTLRNQLLWREWVREEKERDRERQWIEGKDRIKRLLQANGKRKLYLFWTGQGQHGGCGAQEGDAKNGQRLRRHLARSVFCRIPATRVEERGGGESEILDKGYGARLVYFVNFR